MEWCEQAQEEKTVKRITETEIRAKEVLELKKRHTAEKCGKVSVDDSMWVGNKKRDIVCVLVLCLRTC